jgi:hypothetical protein
LHPFPEKHLHTEQEQNDAAGDFERVHVNADRIENDLADSPGGHEDDSGINYSTQRCQVSLCPCERSGQPGEKRHIPNRIDRRPQGSKILANLNQQRRHPCYFLIETHSLPTLFRCYLRSFTFYVAHPIRSIHPSYFFLPWLRFSLIRTADQARGKAEMGRSE